jgi:hypothetical protein
MQIDNFRDADAIEDGTWELWLGELGKATRFVRSDIVDKPTGAQVALLLERLNGFPKAIEFLYKLIDNWSNYCMADVFELIEDFLSAIPHQHSLLSQEEPKPREFRVDFEVVRKGHICVTATTREEAEKAAMETSAQEDLYEYLGREEAQHGDEAVDVRITGVEEAE